MAYREGYFNWHMEKNQCRILAWFQIVGNFSFEKNTAS